MTGPKIATQEDHTEVAGSRPTGTALLLFRVITLSKLFTLMVLRPTQPSIPAG